MSEKSKDKPHILKKFPGSGEGKKETLLLVLGSFLIVLAGVGTGWVLSGKVLGDTEVSQKTSPGATETKKEAGITDESVFSHEVEGLLVEGGIEGEGTHHLERGDDPSKYVYLNSTVINLQNFVGKEVKIWGETISSAHAPWLMDVGKIKVIE